MTLFHALTLGIIEGLTEFLPISSTFHLIFASKILNLAQTDFLKLFTVVIQAGAILAVITQCINTLRQDHNLLKKLMVSFVPTGLVGFLFYKIIKNVLFESQGLMLITFASVGVLFLIYENFLKAKKINLKKTLAEISWQEALVIGFVQSSAIIPGVSRAGAVILGLMMLGFRRDEAATYSFLLAVPTIAAAAGFDLLKNFSNIASYNNGEVLLLFAGFITAFLSALVVVRWFVKYLKRKSLAVFGWYRLTAALFLVTLF